MLWPPGGFPPDTLQAATCSLASVASLRTWGYRPVCCCPSFLCCQARRAVPPLPLLRSLGRYVSRSSPPSPCVSVTSDDCLAPIALVLSKAERQACFLMLGGSWKRDRHLGLKMLPSTQHRSVGSKFNLKISDAIAKQYDYLENQVKNIEQSLPSLLCLLLFRLFYGRRESLGALSLSWAASLTSKLGCFSRFFTRASAPRSPTYS